MNNKILAFAIATLLILGAGSAYAMSHGKGYSNVSADREAAEAALESGDYGAWKALHEGRNGRMAQIITEDNFYILQQMHEAREAGDYEKVRELKAQLGMPLNGYGRGIHNGNCA